MGNQCSNWRRRPLQVDTGRWNTIHSYLYMSYSEFIVRNTNMFSLGFKFEPTTTVSRHYYVGTFSCEPLPDCVLCVLFRETITE